MNYYFFPPLFPLAPLKNGNESGRGGRKKFNWHSVSPSLNAAALLSEEPRIKWDRTKRQWEGVGGWLEFVFCGGPGCITQKISFQRREDRSEEYCWKSSDGMQYDFTSRHPHGRLLRRAVKKRRVREALVVIKMNQTSHVWRYYGHTLMAAHISTLKSGSSIVSQFSIGFQNRLASF